MNNAQPVRSVSWPASRRLGRGEVGRGGPGWHFSLTRGQRRERGLRAHLSRQKAARVRPHDAVGQGRAEAGGVGGLRLQRPYDER